MAKAVLPFGVRRWFRSQQKSWSRANPFGKTRAEMLEQIAPISRTFGIDRGESIDRYYIEQFLSKHASDIRGDVLEIEDDKYTKRFGGERVRRAHVLHFQSGNPRATIVADLSAADPIGSESFDCIILTQTLQFIFDVRSAIAHIQRILRPGGVVLATVPGISQVSRYDNERWGDYWRFTTWSAARLFEAAFSKDAIQIQSHGNALVASAFLHGLAMEEMRQEELDFNDPDYQLLITVRGIRK
ncbi:MAG TPA: methyltransferase domain-containing protein [Terriglobia bacterium]|nr:methyltransferase domain-containing protein [Terriglobia bacterium]